MSVVNTHSRLVFLTTLTVLVLSALACSTLAPTTVVPTPTTVLSKPLPTVPTVQKTLATATVTAIESLHVRADASEKSIVVGYLYNGDQVILTGKCSSGWAQILVAETDYAWVKARYLSDNKCKE